MKGQRLNEITEPPEEQWTGMVLLMAQCREHPGLTPGVSLHGSTSKQLGREDFLGPCPQGHGHNWVPVGMDGQTPLLNAHVRTTTTTTATPTTPTTPTTTTTTATPTTPTTTTHPHTHTHHHPATPPLHTPTQHSTAQHTTPHAVQYFSWWSMPLLCGSCEFPVLL